MDIFKNWHPYTEGRERLKKEDDSSLVDGRFNKQWNILTRFVSGSCKMSGSLHRPPQNLKEYREAFTGFSLVLSSDGVSNTYSLKASTLKKAPTVGTEVRVYVPRIEERVRSLQFQREDQLVVFLIPPPAGIPKIFIESSKY